MLDIVTANTGGVSVLLGNGDGTFQPSVNYLGGYENTGVTVGDMNSDGKPDIVRTSGGSDTVSVLLGNGDGTFQTPVDYLAGPAETAPAGVALGDLNGDGNLDVVTGITFGGDTVSVLLGNGDGTLQSYIAYSVGPDPRWVKFGDLNRDGKPDVITVAAYGLVSVLLGNGDGTLQPPVSYQTGHTFPITLALGDFNGDSLVDVVTADYSNAVTVFLGGGDGTLQAPVDYAINAKGTSADVVVVDLNADGAQDLATADTRNLVSVLLNAGGTVVTLASSANPSALHQPVTFTATVVASLQGVGIPTGTVTFKDGAVTLGSATLPSFRTGQYHHVEAQRW